MEQDSVLSLGTGYSNYPYKFSIVVAFYNTGKYIRDCIESVRCQKYIDFSDVQLILVDDGSTDEGSSIAQMYARQYPNNIELVTQENKGVSAARNAGLSRAVGEFVNFLDSDDILSSTVLSAVYLYARPHKEQADVFTVPVCLFERMEGQHPLNSKFQEQPTIANLLTECTSLCLNVNASFFVLEQIKELRFDESRSIAEDILFVSEVLMAKMALGLISTTQYYYRKRNDSTSALDRPIDVGSWLERQETALIILQNAMRYFGYVPRYFQNVVLYSMSSLLKSRTQPSILSENCSPLATSIWRNRWTMILSQYIDEQTIINSPYYNMYYKSFLLRIRGRKNNAELIATSDGVYLGIHGSQVSAGFVSQRLVSVSIEKNHFVFTGFYQEQAADRDANITNRVLLDIANVQYYPTRIVEDDSMTLRSLGEVIRRNFLYEFRVPIPTFPIGASIRFIQQTPWGERAIRWNFSYYIVSSSHRATSFRYIIDSNYDLLFQNESLQISDEKARSDSLVRTHLRASNPCFYGLIDRMETKLGSERQVWLVEDPLCSMDDSAWVLFKYLVDEHPEIVSFFVTSPGNEIYPILEDTRRFLQTGSDLHLAISLVADRIVTLQKDLEIDRTLRAHPELAAFGMFRHAKRVFIGDPEMFTRTAHSLNRIRDHFSLVTTSFVNEALTLTSDSCLYDQSQVKLTGLPRYDLLQRTKTHSGEILVIPTWRKSFGQSANAPLDAASAHFTESECFVYWQSLFSNQRLLSFCEENSLHIQIKMNPSSNSLKDYFQTTVGLCDFTDDRCSHLLEGADCLVTDWSPVAFDAAYLKIPIIYYQFDDIYSEAHTTAPRWFDYSHDAFGPVVHSTEDVVSAIIKSAKNEFVMEPEYVERVESIVVFHDQNNTERVFNAIRDLDNQS